jgi:hypothetical protein
VRVSLGLFNFVHASEEFVKRSFLIQPNDSLPRVTVWITSLIAKAPPIEEWLVRALVVGHKGPFLLI